MGGRNVAVAVVAAGLAATACASPEWLAELDTCQIVWSAKIPAVWQQRLVERTRYEEVPDGNIRCSTTTTGGTTKTTKTNCTQGKRRIAIPYTAVESYDVNYAARDTYVRQCIVDNCVRKYGNAACKIG